MTSEIDSGWKFRDGNHIRAARTIAGLTRAQLATVANLHPNSIKYWELDKSPWTPDGMAVDQISSALASFGVETDVEGHGNHAVAIVRRR